MSETVAKQWLTKQMLLWGSTQLVPTVEEDPASVWVDDESRVPVAGYYTKKVVPLWHKFLRDRHVCIFTFKRYNLQYEFQVGTHEAAGHNWQYIAQIIKTLLQWIADGVVDWDEAFTPFVRKAFGREWWRILRLPPDANRDEIVAGYRNAVLRVHPDHGGSAEAFRTVVQAYKEALRANS